MLSSGGEAVFMPAGGIPFVLTRCFTAGSRLCASLVPGLCMSREPVQYDMCKAAYRKGNRSLFRQCGKLLFRAGRSIRESRIAERVKGDASKRIADSEREILRFRRIVQSRKAGSDPANARRAGGSHRVFRTAEDRVSLRKGESAFNPLAFRDGP